MKITLAGSRSFGSTVLATLTQLDGVEIVDVISDGTLRKTAEELNIRHINTGTAGWQSQVRDADLLVAAHNHAFLSERVLDHYELGGISYHPSLLPRHRGKDAIRWMIHMGDPVGGGTVYWLTDVVDGGPIAKQDWCFVARDDTASDLWRETLFPMGVRLLRDTVTDLLNGIKIAIPQDDRFATWEPAFDRPKLREAEPEPEVVASPGEASLSEPEAIEPTIPKEWSELAPDGVMTWRLLDAILRRYHEFRALREAEGVIEIPIMGYTINFHDILQGIDELPRRQREAVMLTCIEDMREVDAAAIMIPGAKSAAPIGSYKRKGLKKIVEKYYP